MLNEVMDTVNTDHLIAKLNELRAKKEQLQENVDQHDKEIEEWKKSFEEENGREPNEEDRYFFD